MSGITLIPITPVDPDLTEFLTLTLNETFHIPCHINTEKHPFNLSYNPERKQYHSTNILAQLLPFSKNNDNKILGIVDIDLFIPILTFVFGEAQLSKQCALLSVHRLRQEYYGLPNDKVIFYQRCEKEAIHELGHTMGLIHCTHFDCVMHYSNTVEDIDLKLNAFCPQCSQKFGTLNSG